MITDAEILAGIAQSSKPETPVAGRKKGDGAACACETTSERRTDPVSVLPELQALEPDRVLETLKKERKTQKKRG